MIKRRDRDLRRQLVGEVVNNATEGVKHCDRMSFLRWQEARGEGKRVGVATDDTI
jgi:GH25 family lysozyme M1 (1,4-beta-N-acetylmuramidase)